MSSCTKTGYLLRSLRLLPAGASTTTPVQYLTELKERNS